MAALNYFRILCLFIVLVALAGGCGKGNDAGTLPGLPSIDSVTPNLVNRGQQVTGTISGVNLENATAVNFGENIDVTSFHSTGPGGIEVVFTVRSNASPGPRNVLVTTSSGSAVGNSLLTVSSNNIPVPRFSVTPARGAVNTLFTFDASLSSDDDGIVKYKWDFGDQQSASGNIVSHRFKSTGTFNVALTVTDGHSATAITQSQVEVDPGSAPVARFSVNPTKGDVDTLFHFDAGDSSDSDGTIASYSWNFGDGTGSGKVVDHRFSNSGDDRVVLTVTDNDGLSAAEEKDLFVDRFDEGDAIDQVRETTSGFFKLFSHVQQRSADQILVGWSKSPGCPGREHEKKIIEKEKTIVTDNTATVLGSIPVVIHDNHVIADADVRARFDWTETDGSTHSGTASHHFDMVLEGNDWLICDFVVYGQSSRD